MLVGRGVVGVSFAVIGSQVFVSAAGGMEGMDAICWWGLLAL